jgi:hypothetical protein
LFDDNIEVKNHEDHVLFEDADSSKYKLDKYGQVLKDLIACYNFKDEEMVHEGFSLYVTGHRYVYCPFLYVVPTADDCLFILPICSPEHLFFTTLNRCAKFGRGDQHFVSDEVGIVVDIEES